MGRYSGSTDWRNAVRSFLHLDRTDGEADRATLIADKVSYGPRPADIELRGWKWWSAIANEDAARAREEAADRMEADIIDLLRKEAPVTQTDIMAKVQGRDSIIGRL